MNKTNRIGNSLDRVTRNNREQKKTYNMYNAGKCMYRSREKKVHLISQKI